jgi:HEAT repeat protein
MLVIGLGNMCDPRVIPVLISLLRDEDVGAHAARALGELKAASARDSLQPLLRHPKALVRREAKRAIARIEEVHGRHH